MGMFFGWNDDDRAYNSREYGGTDCDYRLGGWDDDEEEETISNEDKKQFDKKPTRKEVLDDFMFPMICGQKPPKPPKPIPPEMDEIIEKFTDELANELCNNSDEKNVEVGTCSNCRNRFKKEVFSAYRDGIYEYKCLKHNLILTYDEYHSCRCDDWTSEEMENRKKQINFRKVKEME